MIPYFEQPVLHLGPIGIHAFGVLVGLAVLLGAGLFARRAKRLGLDLRVADGLVGYAVVAGFVGAHLFSVLVYFPERLARDPWLLLRFWENLSSFGGMAGGLVGIWIYLRFRRPVPAHERWGMLDAVAFVLPFAWAVGRLACTVASDHPGRITSFFLGRSLESAAAQEHIAAAYQAAGRAVDLPPPPELALLAYHDLGWYEFLYLTAVVAPVFMWLDRRKRPPGFWVAAFVLLYAPVRFLLDFLRVGDARYANLTPAQWVAAAALIAVAFVASRLRQRPSPDQAAGPRDLAGAGLP